MSVFFTPIVDYSLTKLQMIDAGGYVYVHHFLRKNDPVEGKISGRGIMEVALELVHFNRVISTPDALKKIKKMGREPARFEHLLALGAKHPNNLMKEFHIVALGSVWQLPDGSRNVACLYGWGGGSARYLDWGVDDWNEYCRFLVVRK